MESKSNTQPAGKDTYTPSLPKDPDSLRVSSSLAKTISATSVSDTRLPTVEASIDAHIQPGNAFAQMKAKNNGENSDSEKHPGKQTPDIP